jgi:xylitol oxidase
VPAEMQPMLAAVSMVGLAPALFLEHWQRCEPAGKWGREQMNKREFLKASGGFLTANMMGQAWSEQQPSEPPKGPRTNWAGNLTYSTENLHMPGSVEEVRKVVKHCAKLRALGTRHSFNAIADSKDNQISLKRLDHMDLDEKARTVTVGAGVAYGVLAPYIDAKGYAVHNLASLPHISVAGACSTATHGSGLHNGNLATQVAALELVTADGEVVRLTREKDGDRLLGTVVGLGALGIMTSVTLDVQPTFLVAQTVYQDLSFDQLERHFEEIFGAAYSVSLFTDWQNHRASEVWIKRRINGGGSPLKPEFFGARMAKEKLHPIAGLSPVNCTEQQGIPGPWYERLPHFRMNFTPSSGQELQTEYFVPLEHGYEAILAVEKLKDQITPHLLITELRTIAADKLWMSMAYERPSLAIHFTWKPEWPEVKEVLPRIEAALEPFAPRPHWAKLFTMAPERVESQYARLGDFKALVKEFDPAGKFRNEFVDHNLYEA